MRKGFSGLAIAAVALIAGFAGFASSAKAQAPDGSSLYKQSCSKCHEAGGDARAPNAQALRQLTPEAVLIAMAGDMRVQASRLSGPERRAIAEYLTGKAPGGDVTGAATGRCPAQIPFQGPGSSPFWNGWSPDATNTRFQPAGEAGLTAAQVPRLKLKWAFGFPDAINAWAQPSVVGGRVFVGGANGTVYSLDAKTGCIYWAFVAHAGVRTATVLGPREGAPGYAVYFGDQSSNVYAVDAYTGEKLWVRKADDHPFARITGAPTLYRNRLYVPVSAFEELEVSNPDYECCTFRGSVSALDAKTGAVEWKTYTEEPAKPRGKNPKGTTMWGPSGASVWVSPTVDAKRGAIYVATGNNYTGPTTTTENAVVALDMKTGKIRWVNQATPKDVANGCRPEAPDCKDAEKDFDFDFGNAPILAKLPNGRDLIVIGQKSGVGFGMDPDKKGAVVWQYRAGLGGTGGGLTYGSAVDSENAYFPVSDIGRAKPGGLHAVKLTTGERVWYAPPPPLKCSGGRGCNAAQAAAITVIPGVVFSGSNDGAIRAYSTKDGSILWEYDTNRSFDTVNGVPAKGASILGPSGPTVVGGMVFVNSGYGTTGGRPGNVLLAFGLE